MSGSRPSSFSLTSPGPLRLYSTTELLRLPPPTWLVENIMPAGGLVGIYAPPESMKSFLAIDIAMAVSTGLPWQNHATHKGFVVYVSAEGGTGIGKRVLAWLTAHQIAPSAAHVAWLTESIPVTNDSADMDVLFGRLNDDIREQPSLVIIDTLARCFDGDENMQEDMGRFIGGVDRLRREYDATVVVVHHTRLDADRERGSTAFRGAADTMISVKRGKETSDPITILCNKQKDAEHFDDITVRLKPIPGTDSCVIVSDRAESNFLILNALRQSNGLGCSLRAIRDEAQRYGPPVPSTTLKRRLSGLVSSGEIIKENAIYYLAEAR